MHKRFILFIHAPVENAKVGIGFSITRISVYGFLEIICAFSFSPFLYARTPFRFSAAG